ncbi:MAG: ribosome small subunit-dependent GTPase A [Xanthomonadales bacterium]|nr:ribosome small subunit-dependent GTPase A [Xanthomonadales bacterium]
MSASQARVIVSYGAECLVETPDQRLLACQSTRRIGKTVCGDRVEFSEDVHGGRLERVLPRDNSFLRADRRGRPRVVAANLDRIIIVVAPKPEPTRDLVNRYLVACENVGIDALICLNKADLLRTDQAAEEAWRRQQALYQELGYPFVICSAKSDDGLTALMPHLASGSSILVGQSGVGKSSIVQRLIPDLDLRTREISASTGKGRHTTTATTLYHSPGGGDLIDSPGVWEYGIWTMTAAEVCRGFIEFSNYLGQCRFDNCVHRVEPGCAVEAAAEAGEIDPCRLASYRRIAAAMEPR